MASEDPENAATGQDAAAGDGRRRCERSYEVPRISKPDMFMAIALWMERSPYAQSPSEYLPRGDQDTKINKSGAVFVLPNDRALSVDYSKEGVHAAVSALNKFGQEKAKGCQVYLSRRPCSFCTKLLVQCEVSKVIYLPIEPELNNDDDVLRVDTMFKSSSIGLSIRVPRIEESVFQDHDHRQSPYTNRTQTGPEEHFSKALMAEYWDDSWKDRASEILNWTAFDEYLKEQITNDMESLMNWIAHTTVKDVPDNIIFVEIQNKDHKPKDQNFPGESTDQAHMAEPIVSGAGSPKDHSIPAGKKIDQVVEPIVSGAGSPKDHSIPAGKKIDQVAEPIVSGVGGLKGQNTDQAEAGTGSGESGKASDSIPQPLLPQTVRQSGGLWKRKKDGKPVSSTEEWQAHALHMSRLAQMLSQRSDDPTRRVGCVLMVHDEVVAIGWNGFPAKALYGEFPRASNTEEERNKKEPYVIHAEQNALLTKNRNLHDDSSILFINEVPCDECVPLLIQAGVKSFVIPKLEGPEIEDQISGPSSSKKAFKLAFRNNKFDCFGSKKSGVRKQLFKE